jgi:hypothetical protein
VNLQNYEQEAVSPNFPAVFLSRMQMIIKNGHKVDVSIVSGKKVSLNLVAK